ncbi:MAG: hypothetical protein GY854_02865 [Deltaproteobacteria bacterium]|nr:hypothetical protein [Deltaproteobacteria bacterium]
MGKIFLFWAPLAATWLMMASEGPVLTAVIARLENPEHNLAAWGVAFAVAILVESPIIMIMSASTALVGDRDSFEKLRNFTYIANALITIFMVVLLATPTFDFVATGLIGLPRDIADLTHGALVIFLPWPGAIGYRRFYQGLLIRDNKTRRVAMGTIVRVTTMGSVALLFYFYFSLPGAYVGAAALSAGVVLEGIASRIMAWGTVRRLLRGDCVRTSAEPLTYRGILRFYWPLAMTSILALGVHPTITFFVGHSRLALESLAVIPVVNGLSFIFRAMGLSFQEVGIALMGDDHEHYKELRNFAILLGLASTACLGIIAFTPLSRIWYEQVSGLSPALIALAFIPTCIQAGVPLLEVLLSFQRAVLVKAGSTAPITWATLTEVIVIIGVLLLAINVADWIGATAAALAILVGHLASNLYLIPARLSNAKSE